MIFVQLFSNLDDMLEQLDGAFQVCGAHDDFARADALAASSANVISDCQGNDAEGIEDIRRIIQSLLLRFTRTIADYSRIGRNLRHRPSETSSTL